MRLREVRHHVVDCDEAAIVYPFRLILCWERLELPRANRREYTRPKVRFASILAGASAPARDCEFHILWAPAPDNPITEALFRFTL